MTKVRLLAAGCALTAVLGTVAYAAGLFPGFPIVGQAAYCVGVSSYQQTATSPTTVQSPTQCNTTAPAGPTALTGLELVPADTQLANQPPATVSIPMTSFPGGAYVSVIPTTGQSLVIPNGVSAYLMVPAGTLAALTLTMPSAPVNGQLLRISSSQTITSLTLTPAAGQTILTNPSILTISTTTAYGYAFMYNAVSAAWQRVQ
jgi:hypothetical protein